MSALREESWEGRGALCFYCGHHCPEFSGELAHIRGKRMWGDNKENVSPAHKECHQQFHAYGPTGIKPVPKKEGAQPMKPDLQTPPPDPLRMRVPVWRCPTCAEKFYSHEALTDHRQENRHYPVQKEQG
jgi:hypothetical protein